MNNFETFNTKYGKISLYKNEAYIIKPFRYGSYWDEDTLLKLKNYINPSKNILEIGAHCGTSTLIYSSFINETQKIYAIEPQRKQFELLQFNIQQNNLQNKILPYHKAVFCYDGIGYMNDEDFDATKSNVEKRYNEENNLPCNFGGISIGKKGEQVDFITLDSYINEFQDIGYVHIDAQGAENFIFSSSKEFFKKYRPIVYFENNEKHDRILYDLVCKNYPEYKEQSQFDIVHFFLNELNYTKHFTKFEGSYSDDLLVP